MSTSHFENGQKSRRFVSRYLFGMIALLPALSSCYLEVRESDAEKSLATSHQKIPPIARLAEPCGAEEAENAQKNSEAQCYKNQNTIWHPTCRSASCVEVPVYVNYMLKEDLGTASVVHVEAFDNPHFVGSPRSSVQVNHFNTSRPGTYERTSVWLDTGIYYLRAFITEEGDKITPYQYQRMQLVSDKPVGIYGALSSPSTLTVKPRNISPTQDPVHITIDKLFRDPNAKPDTNAYLRVMLSAPVCDQTVGDATCLPVPEARNIIIRLFEDDDIRRAPIASFTLPSESLLVATRPGKTEYLSPKLEPGRYVVFAFVDENSNHFYDEGELAQIFTKLGSPSMVDIAINRTAEVKLEMTRNLQLEAH